jgi:hypothetical protein
MTAGEDELVAGLKFAEAAVAAADEKYGVPARYRRDEALTVYGIASERAVSKMHTTSPITIEYAIELVADQRAKTRARAKAKREAHKAAHTPAFLKAEGKLAQMRTAMRHILTVGDGVEFDDDQRELTGDALAKMHQQLDELDTALDPERRPAWLAVRAAERVVDEEKGRVQREQHHEP